MNSPPNYSDNSIKSCQIRPIIQKDRPWITQFLIDHWGSNQVVSRGRIFQADQLPGYIAFHEHTLSGLITYQIEEDQCEIVSLNSPLEGVGIGSALIEAVRSVAQSLDCERLWVITTNDNTPAIRFYQKRGFHLIAVHPNAVQQSRRMKPSIPLLGFDGIPIRDEIEFELILK